MRSRIQPGEAWDLGPAAGVPKRLGRYAVPEHRSCNRAKGASAATPIITGAAFLIHNRPATASQADLSTAKFARQRKPYRCNNFRAARLAKMATAAKPIVSSLGSAEAEYILFKAAHGFHRHVVVDYLPGDHTHLRPSVLRHPVGALPRLARRRDVSGS